MLTLSVLHFHVWRDGSLGFLFQNGYQKRDGMIDKESRSRVSVCGKISLRPFAKKVEG